MPRGAPYLTKSRFLRGMTCEKLLWLGWHDPVPYEQPPPGSPAALGTLIGEHAQLIFDGGILVEEKPWEHDEAVEVTAGLMNDPSVWVIFEAAFDFRNIRVRVDILERLAEGRWGIREVKSGTRVRDENVHDASVQLYVVRNSGIDVSSVEIVHTNRTYRRGADGIDWPEFFTRKDITSEVEELQSDVALHVEAQFEILHQTSEPNRAPSRHCPENCDYWDRCTANKPEFWTLKLPRMAQDRFLELLDMGIEDVRDVPDTFSLTDTQARARQAIISGKSFVSPLLADAIAVLEGPVLYLDFEAMNPAIPLYEGLTPYHRIPFQWSLHKTTATGEITHEEFLADHSSGDPRRRFTETLIAAVASREGPVVVYSPYENGVIGELRDLFADLEADLDALSDRLFDLLPVIRKHVYLPRFYGSYSIKKVGPALAPDFTYDDLDSVSDGAAAAQAYFRLTTNSLMANEDAATVRQALLEYCKRDTEAMISVHDGLRRLISASA